MEFAPLKNTNSARPRLCSREEVRDGFWRPVTLEKPPYIPLKQMENSECYPDDYDPDNVFPEGVPYETWEWTPWSASTGECELTRWSKGAFCSVMRQHYSNANGKSTLVIVGDSLSMEHYNSFLELLGLDFVLQKWNWKVSFVRHTCDDNVKLVYRGDGRFVRMPTILAEDKPNVLIANRGAHYVQDDEFVKETLEIIPHLQRWQAECSSCVFVYRTSVPGHPKCEEFTQPTNNTREMEDRIANKSMYDAIELEKWHWWDYKRQNELVQDLLTQNSIDYRVIDGYDLNILRPDEHRGGKPNRDCLHGCYPGKVDTYSDILLHILLRNAEEKSNQATETSKLADVPTKSTVRNATNKLLKVQANGSASVAINKLPNLPIERSASHAAVVLSTQNVPATGPRYKDYWLVVSQKLQLAITIVPKVMCSSIRNALNTLECGPGNGRCAEVRTNKALRKVNLTQMTRVAVVRDPFERALSAYENSNRNRFIHINRCHNRNVCTFSEWVQELGKNQSETYKNEHFLPQVNILQLQQMRYDYILRLSSPSDQHFFWNNLCKREHSIKANVAHADTNQTTIYKGLEYFTPEIFQVLSKLYAKDLVLWKKVLRYGTPRDRNERTLYDYFVGESKKKAE